MSREAHVRFCESVAVRSRRATRPVAESFFGLLKREGVHRRHYMTRAEARANIFDYIERFYNRHPRHAYSKGLAPEVYAEQISQTLN